MNVITINEDNHGMIGIALNYYNAVKWLIGDGWIDDYTEVAEHSENNNCNWVRLNEIYEDWVDRMLNEWDIDNFNDFWEGSFYLDSVEVIGSEGE